MVGIENKTRNSFRKINEADANNANSKTVLKVSKDHMDKVIAGESPFPIKKYFFSYFKGIKRKRTHTLEFICIDKCKDDVIHSFEILTAKGLKDCREIDEQKHFIHINLKRE
ncbi:hypothetical protein CWI36_1367p0010 [Hamiltosporidium magnivora]|uniref:Uncharacterized protein n=1 Tax=Hamiltosporidium magnivora TaxID=148818 RepID=A0A4Q9L483_9MICR|nr:hypothetical protein CWI36_1367p0010 [Hamiltosporidium magnivora]